MQDLTQPEILLQPFAESGDKNSIPLTNTDAQNPQLADLTNGFPPITSEDPSNGGLPPERKDFNGLGHLTTTYDFFYQAGGTFTFNTTISSAIGGYPLGARLWHTTSGGETEILRSTIPDNIHNFNNNDMTGWVKDTPTMTDLNTIISKLYSVGSIYVGTQSTCPLETLIPGSVWQKISSNVVISIASTSNVRGNGKAIRFTDGIRNSYVQSNDVYNSWAVKVSRTNYTDTVNVGTSLPMAQYESALEGAIGLSTDGNKSGVVADIVSNSISVNVWKRTA